jgi:formiminotetrahydrofolate cyclodeaminase
MSDLREFLERLASADPVPGGGSVAALQTAMGAALVAMVANLTLGRKKYEEVQDQIASILERATTLRDRASALIDEDIEAYRAVSATFALPRGTDEERIERQRQLQESLKGAVQPPLDTMRAASDVARLSAELVGIGNKSAISDVGTAVLAARAGYHAARLNVEINLALIRDEAWCGEVRQQMERIPATDAIENAVLAEVRSSIG